MRCSFQIARSRVVVVADHVAERAAVIVTKLRIEARLASIQPRHHARDLERVFLRFARNVGDRSLFARGEQLAAE